MARSSPFDWNAPGSVGVTGSFALDYTPQFPLRLMNKDFQLILKASAEARIPMPKRRFVSIQMNWHTTTATISPLCCAEWRRLLVSQIFTLPRWRVDPKTK
jgi:hypothetical protein